VFDFVLFLLLGVVQYNFTSLHAKYEQNPMKAAHKDIQASIYIYTHIIKVNIYLGTKKNY
jgi:hypothetical protein